MALTTAFIFPSFATFLTRTSVIFIATCPFHFANRICGKLIFRIYNT